VNELLTDWLKYIGGVCLIMLGFYIKENSKELFGSKAFLEKKLAYMVKKIISPWG
jgi:hypothetical protein